MALLGGAGPAVVAGLCAFAALGYAIYQVNTSCFTKHVALSRNTVPETLGRLFGVQIVCHLRHYNGPVYQVTQEGTLFQFWTAELYTATILFCLDCRDTLSESSFLCQCIQ